MASGIFVRFLWLLSLFVSSPLAREPTGTIRKAAAQAEQIQGFVSTWENGQTTGTMVERLVSLLGVLGGSETLFLGCKLLML